jgi:hypothetical protein
VTLDSKSFPDLKVVFGGVSIRRRSDEEEFAIPTNGWKMGAPIGSRYDVMTER